MIVALLGLLVGCSNAAEPTSVPTSTPGTTTPAPTPTAKPAPTPVTKKFTLSAIGDVLLHKSVYRDAQQGETYDFKPMLEPVKTYLEQTDLTFANSESIMAGKSLGISDYPNFNSPIEIGDALKAAGVDIVGMANNHTLDKREAGVRAAIQNWKNIGMPYIGAYESQEDRDRIRVLEANGAKVAFIAYTYGTNGIPVPQGKPYLVNLIDKNLISADIHAAKAVADVVVVSMHWGVEYQLLPNDEQKDLAQFAVQQGADVILGHHPHVLQPAEWIERPDGSKAFVIYSLGNFIAAQELQEPYRYIGGIVQLEIESTVFEGSAKNNISKVSFVPTYIEHEKWGKYRVVPLSTVTEQRLRGVGKLRASIETRMTQWMPEMNFVNP